MTDQQLDALKKNGGVIGINAFSSYLHSDSPATRSAIAALQKEFGIAPGSAPLTPAAQEAYNKRYHDLRAAGPKATVADLVNAIDYAVKRIGIDHVAIPQISIMAAASPAGTTKARQRT